LVISVQVSIPAGGVVQVVECLPHKLKAMSSNPITTRKIREKGGKKVSIPLPQIILLNTH
jgi:hypothetical protein